MVACLLQQGLGDALRILGKCLYMPLSIRRMGETKCPAISLILYTMMNSYNTQ